jgi:hypothetical protein
VNTVLNLQGSALLAKRLLASQKGLCSLELISYISEILIVFYWKNALADLTYLPNFIVPICYLEKSGKQIQQIKWIYQKIFWEAHQEVCKIKNALYYCQSSPTVWQ